MSGAPQLERLAHFALVTSDVERTKNWYRDVLGATVLTRDSLLPPCLELAGIPIDCSKAAA